MKKTKLFAAIFILLSQLSNSLTAQISVPDPAFRAVLKNSHGITFDDSNNITNPETAVAKFSLDVSGKNILDLTGIEAFTGLTSLNCNDNDLTSLDVSENLNLTSLFCNRNQLTSLNVSANTKLTTLECYYNQLTSLDVSNNIKLSKLDCEPNQLTELDVSENTLLSVLYCGSNQLTTLDLSANINLTKLYCSNNQLTTLNLSLNTKLTDIYCHNNQMTNLIVPKGDKLRILYCTYNLLTTLDVSLNTQLYRLETNHNQLENLNISGCTQLSLIFCHYNNLASLDISSNINLRHLHCYKNQLTSLDVSNNAELLYLYCDFNNLTSLNVSGAVGLRSITCSGNNLESLDLSTNVLLTELNCDSNQLTSLNVSSNAMLQYLYCFDNNLTSLDVTSNPELTSLLCFSNQLDSLDVSGNPKLNFFDISDNITPFTLSVWQLPFPPEDGSIGFTDTNPASQKILGLLPVELTSFTAKHENNLINLYWETLTETNNAGWEIEGRQNPLNIPLKKGEATKVQEEFQKIGFVAGKGTTTESQTYSFAVNSSELKVQSYQFRLKQIDLDGQFSYSNLLTVNLKPDNFDLSQNYPNPFNPTTAISYQLSADSKVKLVVFDLLGREVTTLVNEEKPAGNYTVTFSAANLPSGVYFYQLTADNYSEIRKMTLVK